jgi:hypothetical protein
MGNGTPAAYTRTGHDWTLRFKPIADALAAIPEPVIADGGRTSGSSRASQNAEARGGRAGLAAQALCSAIPVAQKLWHVSETHLLELSEECFWRRSTVQPATLIAL